MKRETLLWASILAGPFIWFVNFCFAFFMDPWVCAFRWKPLLFAAFALSLLLCAASAGVGWVQWQRLGREMPGEGGGPEPRARMMAFSGLLLSAMAFLVILAQSMPPLILETCQ